MIREIEQLGTRQVMFIDDNFIGNKKQAKALLRELIEGRPWPGRDDFEAIGQALQHADAAVRYWGAVACSAAKSLRGDTVILLEAAVDEARQRLRDARVDLAHPARLSAAVELEPVTAFLRPLERQLAGE